MISALKCPKCDATLGGAVAFCPFCGQRPGNLLSPMSLRSGAADAVVVMPVSLPKPASLPKITPKPADERRVPEDVAKTIVPPDPPRLPIQDGSGSKGQGADQKRERAPELRVKANPGKTPPAKNHKLNDGGHWLRWTMIAAAVIIVTAFFSLREPSQSEQPPPPPKQQQPPPPPPAPDHPIPPARTQDLESPRASMPLARQMVDNVVAPQTAYDTAQSWWSQGAAGEAYVLFKYAADNGIGKAATAIGKMYDPDMEGKSASPFPRDADKASQWYQKGRDEGDLLAK